MNQDRKTLPWVLCPVCWTPIAFAGTEKYEKSRCKNEYCAMAHQELEMHVFDSDAAASDFATQNQLLVLRGPRQLVDFENHELARWLVVTFADGVRRFRLLEDEPLFRLLPTQLVSSWIADVSSAGRKDWFKIIALGYHRESGELKCDNEGLPEIHEIGIEHIVCPFRKIVIDALHNVAGKGKPAADPCVRCHKQLAKKVFQYARSHTGEMRLVTSNLTYDVSLDRLENLTDVCWTGLTSVGFPIIVFDVVIGVGVMNPKLLRSVVLSEEQETDRRQVLASLEISPDHFTRLHQRLVDRTEDPTKRRVFADLADVRANSQWREFRANMNHFQNLAQSRYGQSVASTLEILVDRLEKWLHEVRVEDFSSEQEVWDRIGRKVFKEVALFFSFRDCYAFGGEDPDSIRAVIAISEPGQDKRPAPTLSLRGLSLGAIKDKLLAVTGMDKEEAERRGSPIMVSADNSFWYVFGNRKHTNGTFRKSFNGVCVDLLTKTVRSLHAEVGRILLVHRNLDNVIAMTHNLKRPVAQLANAQRYYDGLVYGEKAAISTALFRQNGYLKDATEVLYDSMVRARKKVEFEANKLMYGRNVQAMFKRKKQIPIIGEKLSLRGDPLSFWRKAVESIRLFAGREELSSLRIDTTVEEAFAPTDYIYIHPDEAQVLLDNLSDNAVKYSYEGRVIEVGLSRVHQDGADWICYTVANFGNGIDKVERSRVGDKFYRGKYSCTKGFRTEGTGLGVYTVKRIVEHVGGKWDWESHFGGDTNYAPGEGFKTTFFIWLQINPKM